MNRMNQTFLKLTPAEKAYEQHQKGERQTGCLLAISLHITFLDQCLTYSIAPLLKTLLSISIIPSTIGRFAKYTVLIYYLQFVVNPRPLLTVRPLTYQNSQQMSIMRLLILAMKDIVSRKVASTRQSNVRLSGSGAL